MMDQIISKQIRKENLIKIFEKYYNVVSQLWSNHQLEWINANYDAYKNHDKYLIVLHLIKKTYDFYSKNLIKETFTEFFKKDFIQIEPFSVMEVSKALNIPKESARRKIIELEKSGTIKRTGKKVFIYKINFFFIKPEKSINRISRFFSVLSTLMFNEKIIQSEFTTNEITTFIEKNFSHTWKLYYELQIPIMLEWKKVFKDVESFHILTACFVNEQFNIKKSNNFQMNKKEYINKYYANLSKINGMNAMSISDISGIPRATVTRKLNILLTKKYLKVNDKKHYTLGPKHQKKLIEIQRINLINLADFTSQIFNLMLIESENI